MAKKKFIAILCILEDPANQLVSWRLTGGEGEEEEITTGSELATFEEVLKIWNSLRGPVN